MTNIEYIGLNAVQNVEDGTHKKTFQGEGFVGAEGFEPPTLCL